jgi:hypothetical protein
LLDDGTAGLDQGSAYVFVRSAGVWSQQQKLVAADAASNDNFGDNFGNSVAISGETLVVGAPFHAGTAGLNRGSAYVFVRNGEVWSEQQKLLAADAASEDGFGFSVTISGETLVVDAPFKAGLPQGLAYVFVHSGGVWSQQQKLLASDAAKPGNFGYSVALSGEAVVVGAPSEDAGIQFQGSAYVFAAAETPSDTPPTITLKAPISLWPPNHKYHAVDISQMLESASDAEDGPERRSSRGGPSCLDGDKRLSREPRNYVTQTCAEYAGNRLRQAGLKPWEIGRQKALLTFSADGVANENGPSDDKKRT